MSIRWITRPTAAAWQALAYAAETAIAETAIAETAIAETASAETAFVVKPAGPADAGGVWRALVSQWQKGDRDASAALPLWPLLSELLATEITLANHCDAKPLAAQQFCAELTRCVATIGFATDATALSAGNLLGEFAQAFQSAQLEKELELRIRPLREQWDAFGPGLLYRVRKPSPATGTPIVIAVPPLGSQGGGWPLLPGLQSDSSLEDNTATDEKPSVQPAGLAPQVLIQAVLTNPHPTLPEVVRLAWLILVAEAWSCHSHEAWAVAGRRSPVELIPLVLEAAEWVELARGDESTRELAQRVWCQPPFPVYNPSS
jgi:hypothetical protein